MYIRNYKQYIVLFVSLVFLFTQPISSFGQYQKISIEQKQLTLKDIFIQIESQTKLSIDYDSNVIDDSRIIINPPTNLPISDLLNSLLSKLNCTYSFVGNHVVINKKSEDEVLSTNQNKEHFIIGNITDENNIALAGVHIIIKNSSIQTITDIDGNFSFKTDTLPVNVLISYLGYSQTDLLIDDVKPLNISLYPSGILLEEFVVIGYGIQSKRSVTGAVQTLSTNGYENLPVAQMNQKIQGKFAGVQINQTTGAPGQGMSVRIRGQASISAGNYPLYVVDGFPIAGDISNLNPDEFESVSILKDASSAALYGSRAANGVVLITTKKAKAGSSRFDFNMYSGLQQIPVERMPDMMNAREFAQFKKEIYQDNGQTVPEMFQNPNQYGKGTNWYKVITRNAPIQNYSLSFSKNKDRLGLYLVGGYFKQDGLLLNSKFERYSLRINTTYQIVPKVKVGINLAPTFTSSNQPQSDGIWYDGPNIIQSALLTSPLAPYKNEDGTIPVNAIEYGGPDYGTAPSPNWYNQIRIVKNKTNNAGLIANGYLELEPIKDLKLKTSINIDMGNWMNNFFFPSTAGSLFDPGNENDASRIYGTHTNAFSYSWMWENIAKYTKSLGDHNIELLAGYTSQKAHAESGNLTGSDAPDNKVYTLNAARTITGGTDIQEWALLSVFGRVNYNYKVKYLVSAAFRNDGSSKFGSKNRWGSFPSVSLGWVTSEENFMKSIKPISFLKFRASYGITGNNNIGNYPQYAYAVITNNPVDDVYYSGRSIAGLDNAYLGWENTKEMNLGLDIGFLKNRINLSYDYFQRTTEDLLYSIEIPISTGYYNYATNIGKIAFWGNEFILNTKNLVGNLKWTTDFNISFNRNKALELGTSNAAIYGDNTITRVGKPLGQLYGLDWDGIYMNQSDFDTSPKYTGAQVGTVKFKDVNKDGVITNDERDKTVLGNSAPKGIYGITNKFSYKNWDLSIDMSGAYGHKIFNVMERFTSNLDGSFNVYKALARRWRSELNPGDGIYGKDIIGTTSYERDWISSKFLYDASYLTIKNITLGYKLPLKNKLKDLMVRVYASLQQVYTFSKYPGMNPEVSSAGGLFSGNDYTTYPVPRTFSLGINIGL